MEYRVNIEAFNYEQLDKLDQRCRFTELKEELGYRLPWDSGSTGVPNCADIDVTSWENVYDVFIYYSNSVSMRTSINLSCMALLDMEGP